MEANAGPIACVTPGLVYHADVVVGTMVTTRNAASGSDRVHPCGARTLGNAWLRQGTSTRVACARNRRSAHNAAGMKHGSKRARASRTVEPAPRKGAYHGNQHTHNS